jgi:hypothetical protein
MDYQIAIPSYKRAELLKTATLATLERYGVDPDRVTIFVANNDEATDYRAALDSKWKIVVGVIGKVNQQRFYHNYYLPGTRLLNLDDDVYDIQQVNNLHKLEASSMTVDEIVELGFSICEQAGAKLWGINPVNNGYFMKPWAVVGLRYICGNFYGNYAGDPAIIGPDRPSSISSGDDYETTFRSYLQNGSVVRIEYLTPITKYFAPGGIDQELKDRGITDRQVEHSTELRAIIDRYPELALLQIKAGGVTNIRVRTKTFARVSK